MIDAKCQMCGEAFEAKTVRARFCPKCLVIRHIQTTSEGMKAKKAKPKADIKAEFDGSGRWRRMAGVFHERNSQFRYSDEEVVAGATAPFLDPETTRTEWRR